MRLTDCACNPPSIKSRTALRFPTLNVRQLIDNIKLGKIYFMYVS